MTISAGNMDYQELNELVRNTNEDIEISDCLGHRFIGSAMSGKTLTLGGIPGNALGAYLNGGTIVVKGNTQDATGDTMNEGKIIIHGSTGDAVGYGMRGGEIYIRDNAGYRAGIHMKEYNDKLPILVIGGMAGSFLGEYQAGGIIIVLGLGHEGEEVGNYCGTGMHGGKIFIRANQLNASFPEQISLRLATDEDINEIKPYINNYCNLFDYSEDDIYSKDFYVLTPNTSNPYHQLYVQY